MQTLQKTSLLKTAIQSNSLQLLLGIMLLFACSQILIPLKPVPITLQTLAVMLIGLTYKPRQAFQVVFAYLLLGAAGMPFFAKFSSGYAYLMGPVAGYYAGFLVAAPLTAWLFSMFTQKTWGTIFASCAVGQAIIYVLGVSWLTKFIGFESALKAGVLPFILPGIIKTVILTSIIRTLRGTLQHQG
jgi:biotin transport system substrate-specific component